MALMRPFSSVRNELDQLLSDMERDFFSPVPFRRLVDRGETLSTLWAPPVDIAETDQEVSVKASVPGIKPEDISVEVEGNTLMISGESKEEREEREKNYYRREIMQGRFQRQVQLPAEVESEKANAHFENGLLMVTIPKSKQSKRRKIQVGK